MFEWNPVNKPNHSRRVEKRAKRTAFSDKTRKEIGDRDGWLCIVCKRIAAEIHHIEYRSKLTEDCSSKRNGCCLCWWCHNEVHTGKRSKELREWLRGWKENKLDEKGDYKA